MKVWVIAAILLISACASPNGEGRSTDLTRNSFTDAADLGNGQWLISCQNTASACTARARAVCTSGFDAESIVPVQNARGSASQYGGGFGTHTDYQLTVRCK